MPKVLLIEDDNNLREIFEMRLQAEGYQTITASDGEQGLAIALKEKPDLIVLDVMLPRLSGFEMLETLLRNPEMANVKVVMMTALGQAEDVTKGQKLGVVKYLVKSQVTLEDFVGVVREVMTPGQSAPTNNSSLPTTSATTPAASPSASIPPDPQAGQSAASDSTTGQLSTAEETSNVQSQINQFATSSGGNSAATSAADPSTPSPKSDQISSSQTTNIPVQAPPQN